MACFPANNMNTQTTLLQASRWKPWEPVLWLLAFRSSGRDIVEPLRSVLFMPTGASAACW